MNVDTFTWFAICLVLGLAALAVTAHVLATDEGIAAIRARLRRRRTTTTKEGQEHAHDSD